MTNPVIIAELSRLATENGGVLEPERVVAAASAETSPLHKYFEWSDSKAAAKFRLNQARELIRVVVQYVGPERDSVPCRVFVSLTSDRREGGYRVMADVLSDDVMRARLLADALEEMRRFEIKYAKLKELSRVIEAIRATTLNDVAA